MYGHASVPHGSPLSVHNTQGKLLADSDDPGVDMTQM